MEEPFGPELINNLDELHGLLLSEEELDTTLDRVARLACTTITGCDSAGVTVRVDGDVDTAAATDDFTMKIDRDQYANGEGPCLEALRKQTTILVEDIENEDRWPGFVQAAARDGLASSLSFPLTSKEKGIGALNLYARAKNAFDEDSRAIGRLFASQASIALSNAQVFASSRRLADQLREAIKSRELIGQAKGILIARESVTDAEAFEMLKRISQHENIKLRDVAQRLVDEALRGNRPSS